MSTTEANPFAMMFAPQQVLDAVEGSSTLRNLRQKQYLLLDRPASPAQAANDAVMDADTDFEVHDEPFVPPLSESVGGSHGYQSFPRIFN